MRRLTDKAIMMTNKVQINLHYFCNECDYHARRQIMVPENLASQFIRAITVPHIEHAKESTS